MRETVTLANGQEAEAEEIGFDIVEEPWAEYKLADGVTVRIKTTVVKILRVLDEKGQTRITANGEPLVLVRHVRNVTASFPPAGETRG